MTIPAACILIVEDDALLRTVLTEALQHEGYSVVSAENGEAAFAAALAMTFDIVLSDIEMDNGNGLWLLKELHTQKSNAPVILMSGNASFTSESARALGAYGFIAKPFRVKAVLSILKAALLSKTESDKTVSIKKTIE